MTLPDSVGPVRVGIFGPPDVVHTMVDIGHALVVSEATPISLSGTSYQRLAQLPGRVRGVADNLDVMLFAGPLPYDVAREAGVLTRPATFVQLSGSSLYGAMVRSLKSGTIDLERVSIDSLSNEAIAEAYEECGLSRGQVRSRPYEGPASADGFAEFHLNLFQRGRTSGALTTVENVARELEEAQVPVIRVRATGSALRSSLRTAAFLGTGSVLEGAQVVIGLIEIPELPRRAAGRNSGPWAMQELRLEVARALRAETDRLAITLMPRDDRNLALVGTLASMAEATREFTVAPFVSRVRRVTGTTLRIGLGMGATATTAETNAELALADAKASPTDQVFVRMRDGSSVSMGVAVADADPSPGLTDSKHTQTLEILQAGLAANDSDAGILDAELASQLLGTSPRTARRVLQQLERDGLAWPVPPASATSPGRPRQTYRLVGGRP
jgi:hypothetical protein